ncbi:MAG: VOC family protein, partial [Tetragenococcus koreensis]
MKLEHIAIWVKDIEKMKAFYEKYFNVSSTDLYHNKKTG